MDYSVSIFGDYPCKASHWFLLTDFRNDYKTLYPWFMESVWWVFAQLFQKGLVYRGFKVMPFSTACSTPLSNFEAGQNYKDTQDPSGKVSYSFFSSSFLLLLFPFIFSSNNI